MLSERILLCHGVSASDVKIEYRANWEIKVGEYATDLGDGKFLYTYGYLDPGALGGRKAITPGQLFSFSSEGEYFVEEGSLSIDDYGPNTAYTRLSTPAAYDDDGVLFSMTVCDGVRRYFLGHTELTALDAFTKDDVEKVKRIEAIGLRVRPKNEVGYATFTEKYLGKTNEYSYTGRCFGAVTGISGLAGADFGGAYGPRTLHTPRGDVHLQGMGALLVESSTTAAKNPHINQSAIEGPARPIAAVWVAEGCIAGFRYGDQDDEFNVNSIFCTFGSEEYFLAYAAYERLGLFLGQNVKIYGFTYDEIANYFG